MLDPTGKAEKPVELPRESTKPAIGKGRAKINAMETKVAQEAKGKLKGEAPVPKKWERQAKQEKTQRSENILVGEKTGSKNLEFHAKKMVEHTVAQVEKKRADKVAKGKPVSEYSSVKKEELLPIFRGALTRMKFSYNPEDPKAPIQFERDGKKFYAQIHQGKVKVIDVTVPKVIAEGSFGEVTKIKALSGESFAMKTPRNLNAVEININEAEWSQSFNPHGDIPGIAAPAIGIDRETGAYWTHKYKGSAYDVLVNKEEKGKLTTPDLLFGAFQILLGQCYMKATGYCQLDNKSDNILVDTKTKQMVNADLGSLFRYDISENPGNISITSFTTCPENNIRFKQLIGEADKASEKGDAKKLEKISAEFKPLAEKMAVFSVAATLFEVMFRELPYELNKNNIPVPPFDSKLDELWKTMKPKPPPRLKELFRKMLSAEASQRPTLVEAFRVMDKILSTWIQIPKEMKAEMEAMKQKVVQALAA